MCFCETLTDELTLNFADAEFSEALQLSRLTGSKSRSCGSDAVYTGQNIRADKNFHGNIFRRREILQHFHNTKVAKELTSIENAEKLCTSGVLFCQTSASGKGTCYPSA